ncbi:death domain protein [Dictyocaulus viviparus]|uniref:Death domain protein n=1 Tax=Dictyocaulus viviparus TaxID=29172 RepID=A0A0D8XL09_DICVI|nr:death domain protein [Dictyocaulus viviparus]
MFILPSVADSSLLIGEVPLHWAARSGHANIATLLINERVDVNVLNTNAETALLIASRHGHSDVVRGLLEHGANVSIKNKNSSCTYSFHGVLPGSVIATYLSDPIANPAAQSLYTMSSAERSGSYYSNDSVTSRPLRAINQLPTNRYQQPSRLIDEKPLNCYSSTTPTTSTFISIVNDIESTTLTNSMCCTDEETALHCAASRGHIECVQNLLDAGSSVDELDSHHRTALICALENGHLDIALLLIHKGCKINEADDITFLCNTQLNQISRKNLLTTLPSKNYGNSPLHVAAHHGLLSAVQTLCHCGADVDQINEDSFTALHLAAKEGFLDIVRVLCLSRSNVLKKTKENVRETLIDQLCPLNIPLRRIKLKLFGHSQTGKTRLIQSLHSTRGITSTIIDDGIHSGQGSSFSSESNNNTSEQYVQLVQYPAHPAYTRGIDVQNINASGCGEFSVWEFGGYESYHMAYDHFVGNTDCIHVILFRACDSTEEQYKQVLYWMNFLKGRVTPTEPIGHCGIISRRSKVVVVGTHASTTLFPTKNADGEYESSDTEAMLKTVRLRFETHFDIYDKLILLDSTNPSCAGMKALKCYLKETRNTILSRLQKPIGLLDATMPFLQSLRKQYANFPVVSWPTFASIVRTDINPLTGEPHCRQLIQQLQLIGEVVYLRDEAAEMDYVVLNPEWLGTHIIGQLLSAEFLSRCRINGIYSLEHFAPIFPEIPEPTDLLRMLNVLQLCAPAEPDSEESFEFPAFILISEPPDVWVRNKSTYVYGGVRVHPMRGMERSLQSTFPRIQVALRRSMHDFQDPMDADLIQWEGCSKMSSGQMEALVRIRGDAVEVIIIAPILIYLNPAKSNTSIHPSLLLFLCIKSRISIEFNEFNKPNHLTIRTTYFKVQVRGPAERATSCFYFLEDVVNLVEQTASEVAPGIGLERHFLSPKSLQEHHKNPASFPPEAMMAMQQQESLSVKGTHDEEELFTDVVCFGSREVARLLTLGIDVGVADLSITTRCELAALLDPPDAMGRDWSILAVKLNLTDQVPEVDSTGQSLSRTDQLLAEWAIQQPEHATVGRLCEILAELGRSDARDTLYRTVPLYLFAPLEDTVHPADCGDSGVVSSCHSTSNPRTNSIA